MRIEEKEIWNALSNIGNTKAPGLDGFNSFCFKSSWKIIKNHVIEAILELLTTSKMFMAICRTSKK